MTRGMISVGRLLAGVVAFCAFVPAVREPVVAAFSDEARVVFTLSEAGAPVVWAPCRTVDVVVNVGAFGHTAYQEIVSALDEVSRLTGLRFETRAGADIPRYAWAHSTPGAVPPVVIAWVDPSSSDLLDGSPGSTVANPGRQGGRRWLMTGAIALDASRFDDFSDGSGPGPTRRNLILHELGHLVGLGHGDGLMNPVLDAQTPSGFTTEETAALVAAYPSC